ncbi:hypothetical protein HDU97_001981 [Phlyctochytrium planicorne]|nr:hypothetical protein HDU97_001981 [Phlyctochytrium planicorne]
MYGTRNFLQLTDDQPLLSDGQAVTIGGNFTRAGMPGSVVTNKDCAIVNSVARYVDPVRCCRYALFGPAEGNGGYGISCSPDGSRIEELLIWLNSESDKCIFQSCPEVSMDALTTLTELTSLKCNMMGSNYRAPFPQEIGNLQKLEHLELGWNMYGEVPPTITKIKGLKTLILKSVTGSSDTTNTIALPNELGDLKELQTLNVNELLVRNVPDSLPRLNLKSLVVHSLDAVTLASMIPKFPNLENLDLSKTNLSNISIDLSSLKSLKSLTLIECQLSSLEFVQNLPLLERLNARTNVIKNFPAGLGASKNLQILNLAMNQIKRVPPKFSNFTKLQEVILSFNQLESIEGLENCPSLQTLRVRNNFLSRFPATVARSTSITWIEIQSNNMTSIDGIEKMANLTVLYCDDNNIEKLPVAFRKLQKLQTLVKSISGEISDMPRLTDFRNNDLETASGFQNLPFLTNLYLSNNQLRLFPDGLQSSKRFATILVDNNKIKSLAGDFTSLNLIWATIDLSNNQIEDFGDTLPPVNVLRLRNNSLKAIPSIFKTSMTSIQTLDLSANGIKDAATDLSNMTFLTSMSVYILVTVMWLNINRDLSDNLIQTLNGTLFPPKLKILKLNGNNFTWFPTSLRKYTAMSILFVCLFFAPLLNCLSDLGNNWINGTLDTEMFPVSLQFMNLTLNCFDEIPKINSSITKSSTKPSIVSTLQKTKEECKQHFNGPAVHTTSTLPIASSTVAIETVISSSGTLREPNANGPTATVATSRDILIPLLPTKHAVKRTSTVFRTQENPFETGVPTGDIPDETPAPIPTTGVSGQDDLSNNSIFKSKYVLPGTVAATMLLVLAMAALVLLFIRRRNQRNKKSFEDQAIDASPESDPSTTSSNNASDSDLESRMPEPPTTSDVKEGLLFQDGVLTQSLWRQPTSDKHSSGLFAQLERDSEIQTHSDELGADANESLQQNFTTCLNLYSDSNDGELLSSSAREVEEEKTDDVKQDPFPALANVPVEPHQQTCLNLYLDDDAKDGESKTDSKEEEEAEQPAATAEPPTPSPNSIDAPQTSSQAVHTWTVQQVQTWMDSIGFREQVLDTFSCHQIDGQRLLGLTDRILDQELGISNPSLRSSILMIRAEAFMNVQGEQDGI